MTTRTPIELLAIAEQFVENRDALDIKPAAEGSIIGLWLATAEALRASFDAETAEDWDYAWSDADGNVHEDENPERALVCAEATGGKLLRSRTRVWQVYHEPDHNPCVHGYDEGVCGECYPLPAAPEEADRA